MHDWATWTFSPRKSQAKFDEKVARLEALADLLGVSRASWRPVVLADPKRTYLLFTAPLGPRVNIEAIDKDAELGSEPARMFNGFMSMCRTYANSPRWTDPPAADPYASTEIDVPFGLERAARGNDAAETCMEAANTSLTASIAATERRMRFWLIHQVLRRQAQALLPSTVARLTAALEWSDPSWRDEGLDPPANDDGTRLLRNIREIASDAATACEQSLAVLEPEYLSSANVSLRVEWGVKDACTFYYDQPKQAANGSLTYFENIPVDAPCDVTPSNRPTAGSCVCNGLTANAQDGNVPARWEAQYIGALHGQQLHSAEQGRKKAETLVAALDAVAGVKGTSPSDLPEPLRSEFMVGRDRRLALLGLARFACRHRFDLDASWPSDGILPRTDDVSALRFDPRAVDVRRTYERSSGETKSDACEFAAELVSDETLSMARQRIVGVLTRLGGLEDVYAHDLRDSVMSACNAEVYRIGRSSDARDRPTRRGLVRANQCTFYDAAGEPEVVDLTSRP